jgi:hypothetical protein
MKALLPSILMMIMALSIISCNAQTKENKPTAETASEDIQVFYFHFTNRCATCNAVENETKVALDSFYPEEMKEGKIDFTSLNLEEDDGKKMAEQLRVSGQTLMIVKGDTKVNLTNEGFMNARTNPDKFQEIIKSQIDKLL